MVSHLISALGFENSLPFGKFVFATKDDRSDLGFLFADVVSYLLKQKFVMVIINFAQSFNHYHHLLSKTGINLKALRDTENIINIDVLNSTHELLEQTSDENLKSHPLSGLVSNSNSSEGLKSLYLSVKEAVNALCEKRNEMGTGFLLFIDEINVLLNLGIPLQDIQPFVHYCYTLCARTSESPGCLLLGAQDPEKLQDDETHRFLTYLGHMSDIRVQVQGLVTGYSKDIHGKIFLEVKNKRRCSSETQHMHFKVEDKGAKLFPFGTSPGL